MGGRKRKQLNCYVTQWTDMLTFQFSYPLSLRSVLGLGALAMTLRGAREAAEGVLCAGRSCRRSTFTDKGQSRSKTHTNTGRGVSVSSVGHTSPAGSSFHCSRAEAWESEC